MTSLSKMQEKTVVVAVAGQCWASAQTPGKPRNVNIRSPHWCTASHGWQLRSPCSPSRSSHLTQHNKSSGNCLWATDGWTNHSPAPSPQARWGAAEVLPFQSWPWERGGKERCQGICHLGAIFDISKVASTLLICGDGLKERAYKELKEVVVQK